MTNSATDQSATATEPALPLRGDTFLGVCEALRQDFGIPADIFRIAFAALFFWSMGLAVAIYLGVGAIIALSRWLYPASRLAAPEPGCETHQQGEDSQLPLAA